MAGILGRVVGASVPSEDATTGTDLMHAQGRFTSSTLLVWVGKWAVVIVALLLPTAACYRDAVQPPSPTPTTTAKKPSATPLPAPVGTQRPEAGKRPVRIFNSGQALSLVPKEGFEYLDDGVRSQANGSSDIASIDKVSQWLFDQKYKCLQTIRITWSGTSSTIQQQTLGDKRAVIECRGDCREIRYNVGAQAILAVTIDHFGLSQPIPVLHLQGPSFGGYRVVWSFTRPNPVGDGPRIALHIWSKDFGDYGGGCRFEN